MKFKIDENLHPEIGDLLRAEGHEVATVFDQGLRGREDQEIAGICHHEGRIMISLDLDFSDIRMYPPEDYPGLIVFRLRSKGRSAVRRVIMSVLRQLRNEPIDGRLWIVDEHRIRVRPARGDDE
jgi:predicted nuclease of predicted toxin-antitoxin system